MQQSAAERPDPTIQRKAAIARGAALEHTGKVVIEPIRNFDLDRTIFKTLEGSAARYVMTTRVGKAARWNTAAAQAVQTEYSAARAAHALPAVSPELMNFLVRECDFNVEHADGSFLDHLYFCFEYSAQHYPQRSALVMLLHERRELAGVEVADVGRQAELRDEPRRGRVAEPAEVRGQALDELIGEGGRTGGAQALPVGLGQGFQPDETVLQHLGVEDHAGLLVWPQGLGVHRTARNVQFRPGTQTTWRATAPLSARR